MPLRSKLPDPSHRTRVGGPPMTRLTMTLKTTTPLLGGAARTRQLDEVDGIRAPSIRGILRQWWRALHAGKYPDSQHMLDAEGSLFGRVHGDRLQRSQVEVQVRLRKNTAPDTSEIEMRDPASYALWPARADRQGNPTAPRRSPGLEFELIIAMPETHRSAIENALRAWILFGGVGGRTRRGVGSLSLIAVNGKSDRAALHPWLPQEVSRKELGRLFGRDIFAAEPHRHFNDQAQLAEAELIVGEPKTDAKFAWHTALSWLRDFRQKADSSKPGAGTSRAPADPSEYARQAGNGRPGRSNWPEPDKLRHVAGPGPWAHDPSRFSPTPTYPRAGFGLPIIGQWQKKDATGRPYSAPEPGDFKLYWREVVGEEKKPGKLHQRLGSPLIVKALPLLDGKFVPMALWMHRDLPQNAQIVLEQNGKIVEASKAAFDNLKMKGEAVQYAPLGTYEALTAPRGQRLRRAFMDWLISSPVVSEKGRRIV